MIDQGRIVASGTSEELKQRYGGDVLEVRLAEPRQGRAAESALAPMGAGPVRVEGDLVSVPLNRSLGAVVQAVRRLDAASVEAHDVALRRPTLDDAFLALTGHAAVTDAAAGAEERVA